MESRKPSPLHLLLFFNFLLLDSSLATKGALQKFDVGVVLDTTSWIGNISWSCIQLAVDDFYKAHPDYTTRLALQFRESGRDAFGAASAVLDLLENVHVQAIIGPQKSTQAKFVIELGNKAQVPIISFSAKSPSLSSIQNPYFIRTALNDSTQAEAIASIVKKFKWKEVVPVFEDSDYGAGIVPYLIDAFQESGAHVPYRSTILLSATNQQIWEELNKLNNMQTRVFVVHMSYSLGLRLFQIAKEMGMLGEGYVWITTYGLTDLVDLVGSSATNVMQGVLGIKPYVKETNELNALKTRWKRKFYQRNHDSNVTEPTVFGLWAYDTVWSLALAAESVRATKSMVLKQKIANSSTDLATLGISPNGPELVSMMRSANFDGMSGKFHLIDGQLVPQEFEIINIVGHEKRRVGFLSPTYGTFRYIESKVDLETIKWPGNPTEVPPRGWEWPTKGKKLKIGVPVKPGFNRFVSLEKDPHTHNKGFCIEVFEDVIKALPYRVEYEYHLFENAMKQPNGTYDDLVNQVYLQVFPRGSPLVPDVSRKILEVIEKSSTALENKLYGNNTCPDKGGIASTPSNLSFKSFWGLFLITGVTSVLAVLLHLALFLYEHRDIIRSQDVSENTILQKLALLAKLYNQSDTTRGNKERDKDEPSTEDLIASPDTLSGLQSPSAMSSYTNSNFGREDESGSPLEGEGSPGREISAPDPEPPSFAEMVRLRLG